MKILKNAFTVATRIYPADGLTCMDRLVRTGRDTFYLVEEPVKPEGRRRVVQSLSLAEVFDWYRLEPWQISRTVVTSGGPHGG
jgi:cobalamin biosynthesis Mg chelatase CobN